MSPLSRLSVLILALSSTVYAAPSLQSRRIQRRQLKKADDGQTNGRYVVTVKSDEVIDQVKDEMSSPITKNLTIIPGFVVKANKDTLDTLLSHPDVVEVAEDARVHATIITQKDATWGPARISADGPLSKKDTDATDYSYLYDESAGKGVDIYVIDTGIYTEHHQFEGRAKWGATFGGYPNADGNGHGTHCAGTVAGKTYGMAKQANLIAVKVLADSGSGWTSDIILGMQYVQTQAGITGRPTVASMSLRGGAFQAVDDAVASLTAAGVHVIVAAGNDADDANNYSPARAPSAVTVAASTIYDAMADYSNYGGPVDIFGPGSDIISSWIGNPDATNKISGTSMATPHIAGLVAYFIAKDGNMKPDDMSNKLKSLAQKNVISGVPSGTVNLFAHNGEKQTSNSVQLHPNGNKNKCIDVAGNSRKNGAKVQIYDCNGTPAQDWVVKKGSTKVQLAGSNFCLDAGSKPASGVGMKIWQCYDNLPAQQWYYTDDNRIAVEGKGQCLDLPSGKTNNGNQLQTWKWTNNNNNQVWTI